MIFRSAALWLIALPLVGCFSPDYQSGNLLCASSSPQCPNDFVCVNNRCWKPGEAPAKSTDLGDDSLAGTDDAGDDGGAVICNANEYSCAGAAGNELKQCAADGKSYKAVVTCPAGMCSAGLGRCNFCEPAKVTCDGPQVMKCDDFGAAEPVNENETANI
jgi:hypothetical protein